VERETGHDSFFARDNRFIPELCSANRCLLLFLRVNVPSLNGKATLRVGPRRRLVGMTHVCTARSLS
jgi:hypothetical protein